MEGNNNGGVLATAAAAFKNSRFCINPFTGQRTSIVNKAAKVTTTAAAITADVAIGTTIFKVASECLKKAPGPVKVLGYVGAAIASIGASCVVDAGRDIADTAIDVIC